MKKICFISTISLTLDSFVLELAKYIHNNTDWDITFVCNDNNEFANKLPDYIHFYPIKMERGISLSGIKAMLIMKKLFRECRFDLIQYSTPNASLYAAMAGKAAHIPVRLYCQWGMAYVGFTGFKRYIFKNIEKYICKNSTWIEPDSISNLLFSHDEGLYPQNMGSVIWNGSACGVNLNKFNIAKKEEYRKEIRDKYHIPKDAFVFGFVGRITRDKGINELFEATKRIMNDNVYLLLVGPEEIDASVDMELYKWSKDCKNVKYTGYTNTVEKYLAAMNCYVLPSYREGFGMSVVEAESMAIPVIISNIPGPINGMIKDVTGFVVEKADVIGLTDAMKRMMISDISVLGENGRKFAYDCFEQQKLFDYILKDRKKLLKIE